MGKQTESFQEETEVMVSKASAVAGAIIEGMKQYPTTLLTPTTTDDWIALYSQLVAIYTGIFAISSSIASLPLKLKKIDRVSGEEEDISTHDVLTLLEKPNESSTRYDLMEATITYLESSGLAYWEIVKDRVGEFEIPSELYPIRPSRLTPIPDEDGKKIKGYVFQVKKYTKKVDFNADDIIPFRYFHPTEDWAGLSALEPAFGSIQLDKQMETWNLNFFKEGTAIEGIFRTDQILNVADIKSVNKMVRDMIVGRGRTVPVLGKGLSFQPIRLGPKDIDFGGGQKNNATRILSALGVPPTRAGMLEHATYDNYRLMEETFLRNTILPKLRKIQGVLKCKLLTMYTWKDIDKYDYMLVFDTSDIFQEDETVSVDRVIKKLSYGLITLNQGIKELGGKDIGEEGDKRYMINSLIPLDITGEGVLEAREDQILQSLGTLEASLNERIKNTQQTVEKNLLKKVREELRMGS